MTAQALFPSAPARVADPTLRLKGWRSKLMQRLFAGREMEVTPAQLQEFVGYLSQGDPLADAVIAMYQELPAGEGRRLVDRALDQGIDTVPEAPPALVSFFRQIDAVPIWVDRQKLNEGADVILRTGIFSELVLRNLSLMGGYLAAAAAKPLVFTGQLDRMAPRRLLETGKFWMDVHRVDGMDRFNEGFKSTVRVRLMHAQVRQMLKKSGRWNYADWGHPINQGDTMATILEFSQILLIGLRVLGFRFTRDEREAVNHLWRYVGYLSGVEERVLPTCEQDALRALWMQFLTFCPSDEDTRALGQALHNVPQMQAGDDPRKQFLARLESSYRAGFSRLMLGQRNGDALGLPKARLGTLAVLATAPVVFSLETLRRNIPGATRAAIKLGRSLNQSGLEMALKAENVQANFIPVKTLAR